MTAKNIRISTKRDANKELCEIRVAAYVNGSAQTTAVHFRVVNGAIDSAFKIGMREGAIVAVNVGLKGLPALTRAARRELARG